MAFNSFFALGSTHIRDFDEARYGVAASEMLHSHSALVTTYAGETEYWNLKPPLGYWLLEGSFQVFGETPFALRSPAALGGLTLVVLTMLFARSVAGAGVGLLAGGMLATCFGFLGHHAVRSGDLDAPLAFVLFPIVFLTPKLPAAVQSVVCFFVPAEPDSHPRPVARLFTPAQHRRLPSGDRRAGHAIAPQNGRRASRPRLIRTERSVGYFLDCAVQAIR